MARISSASPMPTAATKVAYLASPPLPTSPNPRGSRCMVAVVDDAHDPDQESDDRDGEEQFDGRPGDGRQEFPPPRDLVLVVIGQLFEDLAEVARLFTREHHFAEQGRKEIARRGQSLAEGPALADLLADGGQVAAGRGACGVYHLSPQIVRSSIPASRQVDARWLKPASCLSDIRELKNMIGVQRGSRDCPHRILLRLAPLAIRGPRFPFPKGLWAELAAIVARRGMTNQSKATHWLHSKSPNDSGSSGL